MTLVIYQLNDTHMPPIKKFIIYFLLLVLFNCEKKQKIASKDLESSKDTLKTSSHDCTKPFPSFKKSRNTITLIYQRVGCRIDTFRIDPEIKLGDLMDSLKNGLHINVKYSLLHHAQRSKEANLNVLKFIQKDYLLVTPNLLPEHSFQVYKVHESRFGMALANYINIKKDSFVSNEKYFKNKNIIQYEKISSSGTFFLDSIRNENTLISFLDSFLDQKVSINIYMKNKNFIDMQTFPYSEGVELSQYNVFMLNTRNKTLSELGIKEFDVIHYFSICFILE